MNATLRRIIAPVGWLILTTSVAALAYWAGTNAVAPPQLPVDEHAATTYAVETGTVGRSVRVTVAASWSTAQTLHSAAEGVVTQVLHPRGALAKAGDVLATVGLEPIVVAQGSVPMFRNLDVGAEGPDVAQLQALLATLGFFESPTDGAFARATAAAVRKWQASIGATVTGTVGAGSLVFVDRLPARMIVLPEVGALIAPHAEVAQALADTPTFSAIVSGSQRADLASGMEITIDAPDGGTWNGTLGAFEATADGRYAASVTGVACGSECDRVGVDGDTQLSGTIVLVPEVSGIVVPTAALIQLPSGSVAVVLADGSSLPVTVVAEADGFAVVDGLEAGTVIALPAAPGG